MNRAGYFALLSLVTLGLHASSLQAQVITVPNSMNFQGRLATPAGNPVANGTYSIRFSLWNMSSGGTAAANEKYNKTVANVQVKNGTFAVTLDAFPAGTFNGTLWLEVKIGSDAALTPRQPLVTVPYAFKAGSVVDGSITGTSIANGSLNIVNFPANFFNTTAWLLSGNSGTTASQFLGTTDNQPLNLRVNNKRGLRLEPALHIYDTTNGYYYEGVNVIGGSESNSIMAGVVGGTIAGGGYYGTYFGGASFKPNIVTDQGGTISGGANNTTGNSNADTEDVAYSTVAGGYGNQASGYGSAIAGGFYNVAQGHYSFVSGVQNIANGFAAMVLGGSGNAANGDFSFAAGVGAKANYRGSFVWADSSGGSASIFNDTAENQFCIRTNGGMVVEAGGSVPFYTAATSGEKNRYLFLLNSPQTPSASGLKAGGILCADSYAYANPGKNDMVIKGTLGINATSTGNYRLYINGSGYVSGSGVGLQGNSDGIGLYGTGTGASGIGIRGESTSSFGVYGGSSTGVGLRGNSGSGTAIFGSSSGAFNSGAAGVYGTCAANIGVWGDSSSYYGIYGRSQTSTGVFGSSDSHYGVSGRSQTGTGVYGTTANSNSYAGYFLGNLGYSGQLYNQSDRRYKRNIVTFDSALETILQLRGVRFNWRRDEFPQNHYSEQRQVGFIAQEMESILPELVHTDENGYKSVAYVNVVPVLVEAVKTLNARTVLQQQQLNAKDKKIAEMDAKLNALAEAVAKLQNNSK